MFQIDKMTKRINQKLAHKRKLNDEHAVAKKAKQAEKVESTAPPPSCLLVEQLVGGPSLAVPALSAVARCGAGGGEEDPPDEVDEFFAGKTL